LAVSIGAAFARTCQTKSSPHSDISFIEILLTFLLLAHSEPQLKPSHVAKGLEFIIVFCQSVADPDLL
jgi:hypothetical protein